MITRQNSAFSKIFLTLACCVGSLSATACDTGDGRAKVSPLDVGRAKFQTAIAIPDRAYQVYWLGSEFTAAGLVFHGPLVPGFEEPSIDAIQVEYNSSPPVAGLDISLMSSAHWDAGRGRVLGPGPDRPTIRQVTVAGAAATLYTVPGSVGRPVGGLFLTVELGDTVVYANTGSVGPATPGGPEANPLIDEQTFLAVMQNLRPYPQ